jgi:hypothetical protein
MLGIGLRNEQARWPREYAEVRRHRHGAALSLGVRHARHTLKA